ncbi:GlsB/YeaQ/YmgE family stress response membrane protein [Nakamurella deserti]|uniref:GlsB/YeaQ/YmgE family stress response membrane protein n=1 Tax=Nakamurella deserti TaxID=2164074 RepID=UPI000DBE9147|nr:hypothetical protein [Nakamurella deserti]
MLHLVIALGFFVAVGAVVGLLARFITFDRFRLSLPRTIALGTIGAAVAPLVQWWVLTPEARATDSSSCLVSVLGAIAAMAIYRAWVPASAAATGERTA